MSEKILPEDYIYSLLNSSDCYVAPHHGEGWGMPIHDAMYAGKHIITTKFGGVTEFLDNDSVIFAHERNKYFPNNALASPASSSEYFTPADVAGTR